MKSYIGCGLSLCLLGAGTATKVSHEIWDDGCQHLLIQILNGLACILRIDFGHIVLDGLHEALLLLLVQLAACAALEIGIQEAVQHGFICGSKELSLSICSGPYVRH